MTRILVSWIGQHDLDAANNVAKAGLGPIGQAVKKMPFDRLLFLCNYAREQVDPYLKWLKSQTKCPFEVEYVQLSSPTEYGEIYREAVRVLDNALERYGKAAHLTFHTSPGTKSMLAIWVILAKTKYEAELIESSPQAGVKTVTVPFELSAEIIPNLFRRPDEELERLSAGLPPEAPEFSDIIHRSTAMQKLIAKARLAAQRRVSVLIEGESGTGKELLARAIHEASPRNGKRFVPFNCGAIPANLIESELFGHEKGAFTGANARRIGHFEEADGGTVFLDEVGELPMQVQVALLRVLQEGEVTRVGSSRAHKIDVRVIAATNRNVRDEVIAGRFREDLFYRLAVITLKVPRLCDREGDVGLLIDKLLERINTESAQELMIKPKTLSSAARNLLLKHDWPGNVRELQNTLLRVSVFSTGATIGIEDVRDALSSNLPSRNSDVMSKPLGNGFDIQKVLADVARHYLKLALEKSGNRKKEAADLLGLPSYQRLDYWLKKYDLNT